MQTVTPYLLYEDGEEAIKFATRAFGFHEVSRTTGAAGGLHAELEADGGGRIYFGQPTGDFRNPAVVGPTSQVYVLVDEVDRHHEKLNDLPFGHRRYGCADPQGHEWYFAEVLT